MKREDILWAMIVVLHQQSSFRVKLTKFILNKVKEKRNSEGWGGEMGRIFKLINTKKLATHDNIVQVMIAGHLGWEREKERDQRKLTLRSYMFSGASGKVLPTPPSLCRSPVVTAGLSDSWESRARCTESERNHFILKN